MTSTSTMYVILGILGFITIRAIIKRLSKLVYVFLIKHKLWYIVVDMVDCFTDSYKTFQENIVPTIDHINGMFQAGMRWNMYVYALDLRYYYTGLPASRVKGDIFKTIIDRIRLRMYLHAIRTYIVTHNIRKSGDGIDDRGYIKFVFSDNTVHTIYMDFAWCDLMAAVWSDHDGRNYSSFTFYSANCVKSLSPSIPAKIKNSVLSVISL